MHIFHITSETSDTSGNTWQDHNEWFVTADSIKDVEAVFPKYRGFRGFKIKEIIALSVDSAAIDAKNKGLL